MELINAYKASCAKFSKIVTTKGGNFFWLMNESVNK